MAGKKEAAKRELRDIENILQGIYDPRKFEGVERKKKVRELQEQIPQLPTRDLVAKVIKYSSKIDEAAKRSQNLKGTFVGLIRDGALYTRVAVDALSTRLRGEASEREEQMREELASLKAQVAGLLREKEERDRRRMPPPPPPGPLLAGRHATPPEENVREEEMPEVGDDSLPTETPPPGERAAAPPPEKRTWDVVTPSAAGTSRASTSRAARSRTRKERSVSRKRANPETSAKDPPRPPPRAPQQNAGKPLTGMAGNITGEEIERRMEEIVGRSQQEIDQRLQRMEEMIRTLVDGGARDSGPAADPTAPRKGGGGAVRDRPVPGTNQGKGSKGSKDPPKEAANAVGG
ncbi:PREDICTED: serine/arginine repetitive matrix protein 1-like [Vollenhovia emeryi]|uniref:serine/arginine repetitive matrix protein 1-like n=1 Tax=Vollenhovia emeryi TaxID=411798 RepID=UPI0005F453A2|nr:PREDICTED: serine/arginine repetitive matrix protein 1-like [Vollenhovia emeryi]